jgi:hypothetical protein
MDELEKIVNKLDLIQNSLGAWGVAITITLGVLFLGLWIYFKKTVEKSAEVSADKSLQKFQSHLDKELVKFSTKHQKQIDAVHECYSRLQRLTSIINYTQNGEKFTQQGQPEETLQILINARHDFKIVYRENRLLFSKGLCGKIDKLIPTVDKYIEVYEGGLLYLTEEEIDRNAEENNGVYIAGLWRHDAFNEILSTYKVSEKKLKMNSGVFTELRSKT